ncbi:MAG: N-6 DNA methylase [Candidatus ainarchaeum sp.]|nr:N-6 DNA methylase [Candidatus ainarchaeum sp.]MDD3084938.1 N-6 DNA methylase [Candidatus ainarchaeum sp.]
MVYLENKKYFVKKLGFNPKDNTQNIYIKKYFDNYIISIDFENQIIDYGKKINCESKTTQNFSQEENWVVLECVNRLLEKGYIPSDLFLEKVYPTGHGTSGRLDVLVYKNKKAYLMIECKTFGKEFKKELDNLNRNGGQLFTYFQQDRSVEYLILYTSKLENNEIVYTNEIVKIEDAYRETSNVKDFYERWSKLTLQNGLFENWVYAYDFKSKALTLNQLKNITHKDSSFIFNRFLEILRHNVVSDKPNAFNKIFTLFLCKIVDENRNPDEELDFQWIEGVDDDISFQKRLTDLYKRGMQELLSKEVTDISDDEFNKKYGSLDDGIRENILKEITKIRLQKNNEFAIKEVFDEETFKENAKVLKEVVELLQIYKIRYSEKQQYLSDFFELLLTTGLKQESGQFFTPIPIARFICRSIPLDKITQEKLIQGISDDLLPTIIDYAAGSGHFLTESMNEIQNIIKFIDETKLKPQTKKQVAKWKADPFDWAWNYMYGVEKDYRLVKTAKVGCYLHGDGIAQVIHSDGLGNFENTKEYKDKLKNNDKEFSQDNKRFDVVISNPPYSVSAFKANLKKEFAEKDFELYKYLTEQSSEIECLFVERTKQLLKDGGIAGIILPSSILSNNGIYTKTREIILKYFEIVSIVELGSNTFMATGTNTVILFLKRRNNYDYRNIQESINKFASIQRDITVNQIENCFSKYANYVWGEISFKDYISIFKKIPNENILKHEIYKEYQKIKLGKNENLIDKIIELEKEKLLYFILVYSQKLILVKSGEKNIEKEFLGYEFSNRRGSEGIHPIQRGKSVDECTKLFDIKSYNNPKKVSTYIYAAFENNFEKDVNEELDQHVSKINLIDMMYWNRNSFEKTISLNIAEKIEVDSKFNSIKIDKLCNIIKGVTYSKENQSLAKTNKIILTADNINLEGNFELKKQIYLDENFNIDNIKRLKKEDIFMCFSSGSKQHVGKVAFIPNDTNYYAGGFMGIIRCKNKNELLPKYLYSLLNGKLRNSIRRISTGSNINNLSNLINDLEIPLPPKDIQEKLVKEIENLEKKESFEKNKINELNQKIINKYKELDSKAIKNLKLSDSDIFDVSIGKRVVSKDISQNTKGIPVYSANVFEPFGFIDKNLIIDFNKPSVLWGIDGDWMVNYIEENKPFYPTDHCGFIRVNDQEINPKYLKWLLEKAGKNINFSRNYRASIDRIKNISIKLPSIQLQNKIISEIEKNETEILKISESIKDILKQKEKILEKYL